VVPKLCREGCGALAFRQAFSLRVMHGTRVCPGREEVKDEMCSDDSPYPRSPNISLRSDPGTISTV
jgi:hypothetical protein